MKEPGQQGKRVGDDPAGAASAPRGRAGREEKGETRRQGQPSPAQRARAGAMTLAQRQTQLLPVVHVSGLCLEAGGVLPTKLQLFAQQKLQASQA